MATVGDVQKYIIKTAENTEILIPNKFAVNPLASYEDVNSASNSILGLSENIYSDTALITNISTNDQLFNDLEIENNYNCSVITSLEYPKSFQAKINVPRYFPDKYIILGARSKSIANSLKNINNEIAGVYSFVGISYNEKWRRLEINIYLQQWNIQLVSGRLSFSLNIQLAKANSNIYKLFPTVLNYEVTT